MRTTRCVKNFIKEKRMKKQFVSVLLILFIASFVFAGGAKESSGASGESGYRDHFVAAINTMPVTLHPGDNDAPIVNDLVYDELIRYNKVTKEFEPGLAVKWEWIDDTATAFRMELRQGVKFHNGNPFTAEDVEYTLSNKGANSNVKSAFDHAVIIDDYTIEVYLKSGDADYFSKLSNTLYAGVLNKASVLADPDSGTAIGTGPWKYDMKGTLMGDTYKFVRNEDYWGRKPITKQLTLRYISSASSRLIALQNDEVQAIMEPNAADVDKIKNDPRLEYHSGTGVGPAKLYYIGFNMINGKGAKNIYLRQAIARAMSRADIIATSGDLNAVESDGIFWGANTAFKAPASAFKVDLSYDLDAARALVKKAEQLNGGPFGKLTITGNTTKAINMSMCLVVQQACKEIGLDVDIEETDSAGIKAKTDWNNPNFDIIQYNVPLEDWASAVNRMFLPFSGNNRALINDDYVTDLITTAAAITDQAERARMYQDLQVYIHDNAIYVPAYYGSRDGAQRKGVEGVVWSNDGYPEFAYATVRK